MINIFMEEFKKRLTKGLIVGGIMVLLMVLSPILMGQSAFASLPWYLVPVVLIITVLYGTGWYFAFNLIKRAWRKFLRVNRDASIWQALTGHGIWLGLLYSMLCFVGGCFLAFVVGNYFMLRDFLLAKQGKPPISVKYKFDSDLEYDAWARDLSAIRDAVTYSDAANGADAKQRFENEINLQNIENGYVGTVTTDIKDGDKHIKKETTVY